jgi:hypothetical protein
MFLVGAVGIEPTTNGLKVRCSTAELYPQSLINHYASTITVVALFVKWSE